MSDNPQPQVDTSEVDVTDTRTVAEKAAAELQLAEVIRMKNAGRTFQQIGDHFGFSRQHAHTLFWSAFKGATKEAVEDYRAAALSRYEQLRETLNEVMARDHIAVSQGRVVRIGEPFIDEETGRAEIGEGRGEPVHDDMPKIAAARVLVSLEDRESKLLGLDTPVRQELDLSGGLNYKINGVTVGDLT